MPSKDDKLLDLAIARFGAAVLAQQLKVSEITLISWAAGTLPMSEEKRLALVDHLRKQPKK